MRTDADVWPAGEGEMARRVRAFDWAATPLGASATWPQSLRTAVDMVLAMPGPATILWGPTHVQLYNDAYVAIAQERHPALLGVPVSSGWSEVYEAVIAPLLEAARAGRATRQTGFAVTLRSPDGSSAERIFDTDWSPIETRVARPRAPCRRWSRSPTAIGPTPRYAKARRVSGRWLRQALSPPIG